MFAAPSRCASKNGGPSKVCAITRPPPNPPLAGGKEGFDSGCVHVGRAACTVEQDGASDSVHVSVLEANGV
jgi:hypothetical protein